MINRRNKKGDMSANTIVAIILLALGFLILVYLYFQFNWNERADSEACHQSIVLRATITKSLGDNSASAAIGDFTPLHCLTDKICITADMFGGCKEFKGLKGITRVRVSDKEDIEKTIARALLDCWSMSGQGRLSVFNDKMMEYYGLGNVESNCLVCARVAYDVESLKNKKIDLSSVDVSRYMDTHLVTGKELTYSDYLSEGSPAKFKIGDNEQLKEQGLGKALGVEGEANTGDLAINPDFAKKETAVIFMQVQGPPGGEEGFWNGVNAMGLGIGGASVLSPRMGLGMLKLVTSKAGLVLLAAAGIYQQFEISRNTAAAASYCSETAVGTEQLRRCSVVRTMNYDAESISQYCSLIESIP